MREKFYTIEIYADIICKISLDNKILIPSKTVNYVHTCVNKTRKKHKGKL